MSIVFENIAVNEIPLMSPESLISSLPLSEKAMEQIEDTRRQIRAIIQGNDDRLLVIVGPCSVHDVFAALEYAALLKRLQMTYADELLFAMRVYCEKPRTLKGWKGLINDPHLDHSHDVAHGLYLARKLLVDLAEMGMPAASEFLDVICTPYISDAISWGAIGARTCESQIHRELASGLSMPIGFKNGTHGNLQPTFNALSFAKNSHHCFGISQQGKPVVKQTQGNDACHLVLRGSDESANYFPEYVLSASQRLNALSLNPRIMIDCSHGNAQKDYLRQIDVADSIACQVAQGSASICGAMLESSLLEGNQALSGPLKYGQSITDPCLSFEQTQPLLEQFARAVRARRS